MHEKQLYRASSFLTLTYNERCLPTLVQRDLQLVRRRPVRVKTGLSSWGPHVRSRRVQTLIREGSPLVKLGNSA